MADPTGSTQPDVASNGHPPPAVGARTQAPATKGVWERLQHHKVMQWTLAYAALAYTLLHTTEMVSNALEWPHLIVRVLTIVLFLAVPVVVLLAWYHGHKAQHRISTGELSLLTVMLLIGAGLLWAFTRNGAHAPARVREADTPAASVAVVPFANLTGEPGKEYFSDGMAEELINELTHVPGLKVPARTSSFAYKGRNIDIRQIAHDLGVASILEGSVRSAGDRIRVTAQLVNAQTGYHYWSQTYDRDFGDVFKLEDEISAEIVEALKKSMNAALPAAVAPAPPTRDPEAYRLYLQAVSGPTFGLPLLDQAIMRDPQFARAYAARALQYAGLAANGAVGSDPLTNAERDAGEALALDPTLMVAQIALGTLNAWRGNWLAAESVFRRVLGLDPQQAYWHSYYGSFVLEPAGHMRQGLDEDETAYRLAPANAALLGALAAEYSLRGADAEAIRYGNLAVAAGAPRAGILSLAYSNAARRSGRYADAAAYALPTLPAVMRTAEGSATIRNVFAAVGTPANRAAVAQSLGALVRKLKPADLGIQPRQQVISWYVWLGDLDSAFEFANRSLDEFARSGTVGTTWGVLWMPEMRPFRRDPRFQAFATRLKLFDYWKEYGPPDECDLKDGKLTCR